ncbi:TPM domain-containing protein [Chryseolinea sp. H1M3-3]|uniref:TPM domain-containing protein n=1 Tax=Chryseolinea sp. H1M3-3 TaxID=3034144 RepID=UPI0023EAA932|nr:TPM domain-containing protein [Chryseolinea sp. H1M3-3]
MNFKEKLSDADLQRIKAAVKSAEEKISGEIVPVIVERSGNYTIANYKGSLIGGSLAFIVMIIFDRYIIKDAVTTLFYDPVFIFLVVILGGVLGAVIPNFSDSIKRLLVARKYQDLVTRQSAENAFLEEEVFNTRQRTGIMIFVSFFEHEVIIMADKGISQVVAQAQWDQIVQDIINNIRRGKIVEAMEDGIQQCGKLLLEKGFKKTDDDTNELHDNLRF